MGKSITIGLEEFGDYRYNIKIREICGMGNHMEKELRKWQNLLVDAGTGVILFAAWSVVRVNLYLAFLPISMEDIYNVAAEVGINKTFFIVFMLVLVAGILLWQLSIRLYIRLSATAEGQGKQKGYAYLVVAAVLFVTNLQFNWQTYGVDQILAGEMLSVEQIVSLCMEAAAMYVLIELLISGIRVKILKKKMKV